MVINGTQKKKSRTYAMSSCYCCPLCWPGFLPPAINFVVGRIRESAETATLTLAAVTR